MAEQAQPGPIPEREYQRLLHNHCERKKRRSRGQAMQAAADARQAGRPWSAYRCVFTHGAHWHVGNCPVIEDVALMARWLRFGYAPYEATAA